MQTVYRFGDCVALSGKATRYLTPRAARALARAIVAAARSCEREAFTESSVATVTVADYATSGESAEFHINRNPESDNV